MTPATSSHHASSGVAAAGANWRLNSYASPQGRQDKSNEDSCLVIDGDGNCQWLEYGALCKAHRTDWPAGRMRLVIIDGMGGRMHGDAISAWTARQLAGAPAFSDHGAMWEALDQLHLQARWRFAAATQPPGAAVLLLEIPATGPAWLYHVGDCRLWLVEPGCLALQTLDHCPASLRALRGEIDLAAWRRAVMEQHHSQLFQAFGLGSAVSAGRLQPELFALTEERLPEPFRRYADRRLINIAAGQTALLASDGLWCCQQPQQFLNAIAAHCTDAAQPLQQLAERVMQHHLNTMRSQPREDNTTAIFFRRHGGGSP